MHILSYLAASCNTGSDAGGILDAGPLPNTCANGVTLGAIFTIAFSIIGAVAFLFLVIGGVRYTFSGGDPENVKKAKDTLRTAIIGLVIAAMGVTIVNFVISFF
jgi:hypothetical protein